MSEPGLPLDELSPLLAALCDGTIGAEGVARLEALLAADPAARRWYLGYLDLHVDLLWDHLGGKRPPAGGTLPVLGTNKSNDGCNMMDDELSGGTASPAAAVSADRSSFILYPSSLFPHLVGDVALAYAVALLLLGFGVLAAWMWSRTDYFQQLAKGDAPSAAAAVEPKTKPAAMITAVADVRWIDPRSGRDYAVLGAFGLASGLMEITYNSGVRVILQGPVEYQIISESGGFLWFGKATVFVEEKDQGEEGEKTADRRPASRGPSSFTVSTPNGETPNVIKAGGGAEFGVRVDGSGTVLVHAFRGALQARPMVGKPDGVAVVQEGKSVALVNCVKGTPATVKMGEPPTAFVRRMPQPPLIYSAEKLAAIGRVTRMVDCRWADPSTGPKDVALGRFHLASGLVEITYNSGVKVILQGPVRFMADSPSGGWLWFGKLTAMTGEKEDRRKGRTSADEKAEIADGQWFTVHAADAVAPSAIRAGRGAEFGFEVEKSGTVFAHAFRGDVRLEPGVGRAETVPLPEGTSAVVGRGPGETVAVAVERGKRPTFVRRMPKGMPVYAAETNNGRKTLPERKPKS